MTAERIEARSDPHTAGPGRYATKDPLMSLQSLLSHLLSEPREAVQARVAGEFHCIAAPFEEQLVISGTGHLGRLALSGLRSAGIEPLAFCDNNPQLWGKSIDGLSVISPQEAAARYKYCAAFVVAIYNSAASRNQLRSLGCLRIVPYPALFWTFSRFMPNEDRMELPQRILDCAREMEPAYNLLSDERSRREFCAQIRWRCLLDYDCLPPHDDPREMYFPADLFRISPEEVFVDCGALDGDSLRAFLSAANGQFSRIYTWEADAGNVDKLSRCVLDLPSTVSAKVTVMPYAVGRQDGKVWFNADGTGGSRVTAAGSAREVQCRSLDGAFTEVRPSLIKMDIEGAEPEALPGAARTMARHRPIMAVCAYHKCDHLWTIPQLLKAANPGYSIFLRRYAEDCWETVYYAVPPERLYGNAHTDSLVSEEVACLS
jgi:FkbM family methyltransferase